MCCTNKVHTCSYRVTFLNCCCFILEDLSTSKQPTNQPLLINLQMHGVANTLKYVLFVWLVCTTSSLLQCLCPLQLTSFFLFLHLAYHGCLFMILFYFFFSSFGIVFVVVVFVFKRLVFIFLLIFMVLFSKFLFVFRIVCVCISNYIKNAFPSCDWANIFMHTCATLIGKNPLNCFCFQNLCITSILSDRMN